MAFSSASFTDVNVIDHFKVAATWYKRPLDRPTSSQANIYLTALKNRFVCLDLTHSQITMRCVAVFAKKVNFVCVNCLHILCILDHLCACRLVQVTFYSITFTQHEQKWSAGKSEFDHCDERKCQIIHIKFRLNTSLVRRVNLLCDGEGKQASVKVLD